MPLFRCLRFSLDTPALITHSSPLAFRLPPAFSAVYSCAARALLLISDAASDMPPFQAFDAA